MSQTSSITKKELSIAESYQQQKAWYALSSQYRPTVESTIDLQLRQTQFPCLLNQND